MLLKKKKKKMATLQDRTQLDAKAKEGQTVVPGGTGGKSLEAQEHLAEGGVFNFHICVLTQRMNYKSLNRSSKE